MNAERLRGHLIGKTATFTPRDLGKRITLMVVELVLFRCSPHKPDSLTIQIFVQKEKILNQLPGCCVRVSQNKDGVLWARDVMLGVSTGVVGVDFRYPVTLTVIVPGGSHP